MITLRKVIFDPKVEEHKFQIPPKPKTNSKPFAKEVFRGAAERLLPSFSKTSSSPV
jgi:hypothetical protein